MANIKDFKGVLVYTDSTTEYTLDDVHKFAKNAPYVKDYVILNREHNVTGGDIIYQALDVAKLIYQSKPTARIWLGTPTYDSELQLGYWYNKMYLEVLKSTFLDDSTGRLIWKNCVKGIYINMESIYGDVDYTSSNTLLENESIKLANDIAYYVRNELQLYDEDTTSTNLDVLWIPYYGYAQYSNGNLQTDLSAQIIKNLGYVISRTNIFDIAIIQPAYYEFSLGNSITKEPDTILVKNLDGVKYSLDKNSVCYRNGVEVISRSTSTTATIGFEMEIDNTYDNVEERGRNGDRYNKYVDKFINYRNKPVCYYAGGKKSLTDCIYYINLFYNENITVPNSMYT